MINMELQKKNAYTELLFILAAIITTGILFKPEDPLWTHFNPSPYWLVVILIALRYENPAGIVAGICCALIQLVGIYEHFNFNYIKESVFINADDLLLPGAFVITGYYCGECIFSAHKRTDFHIKDKFKIKKRAESLERDLNSMEKSYRQLEGRIAGDTDSLYQLLSDLKRLELYEGMDLPALTTSIIERYTDSAESSYWRYSNEKWKCLFPLEKHKKAPALLEKCLEENRCVTVKEFPTLSTDNDCDIANVILKTEDGTAFALCANKIKFSSWHSKLTNIFKAISHSTSIVLKRQLNDIEAGLTLPLEKALKLSGEHFFRQHVQKALLTQERKGGESTVLFLRPSCKYINDKRILTVIASVLRCCLRNSDSPAFLMDAKVFAVFLPETPITGATIATKKIAQAIDNLGIPKVKLEAKQFKLNSRKDLDKSLLQANKGEWLCNI